MNILWEHCLYTDEHSCACTLSIPRPVKKSKCMTYGLPEYSAMCP